MSNCSRERSDGCLTTLKHLLRATGLYIISVYGRLSLPPHTLYRFKTVSDAYVVFMTFVSCDTGAQTAYSLP